MSGPVKGLQGILYDSEASHLLICDAASGRIIKLNATTGIPLHWFTFLLLQF